MSLTLRVSTLARLAGALALEVLAPAACAACDAPVPMRTAFCPPCAATLERAPHDPSCLAAHLYGGALARAIMRFKYESRPDLSRPLAALLRRSVEPLASEPPDLVCPVPLHPARLADRGFNQAALLGAPVARALGVAWDACALARTEDTVKQATLDRAARRENVAKAFRARHPSAVRGARVLVVDDVCTTGSTLAACAEALERAGAREVVRAVVARADL